VELLLLSDAASEVRDLLPNWPGAPWRAGVAPLKATEATDLRQAHPDIVLVDATGDLSAAEDAARRLSLAWEIGLPSIVAVLDEASIERFSLDAADDFIMARASTPEISARLSRLVRRARGESDEAVLRVGELTVNPSNYQVYVRGRPLDLTFKEFELIRFLSQRPGRVCDRDLLLREVWGYDYFGGTRTVDVHVRRLRAKLGPEHEALIETVRNVGYRLVPRPRDR
jgi:DNA-binding response OmpR family regulator